MISYIIIPQVVCTMCNLKCSAYSKYNVTMQTTAEFASNLTAKKGLLNVSNLDII